MNPVFIREMVTTSWYQIACYYAGPLDGPPLVLLHGFPSSTTEFCHLLPGPGRFRVFDDEERLEVVGVRLEQGDEHLQHAHLPD